jgi:WD40 repeat protein
MDQSIICKFKNCNLIYENPIILPCGKTLCKCHLDKFKEKFECCLCFNEHEIPEEGYVINESIRKKIDNYLQLNPIRKMIKESFDNLSLSFEDYDKFDSDSYIYDYFRKIVNEVDLHREELIQEINKRSDEIISQLKEKEEKCKSNLNEIKKYNFDQLKQDLPDFKKKFRNPILNLNELRDLSFKLSNYVQNVQNLVQKYKNKLLSNKSIEFKQIEKSILFGQLNIKYFDAPNVANLLKCFNQHTELITSICVTEDSKKLISSSKDTTIKIWDIETGECLKTLDDHKKSVNCIISIPNNKFISGSWDKTIKMWDLYSYKCTKTLRNKESVFSLCLMPENKIACGSRDGSIYILDLDASNSELKSIRAFENWITYLKLVDNSKLIVGSNDKKIKIFYLKNLHYKELHGHLNSILYYDFSMDGYFLSCSKDQTVIVWEIESGKILKLLKFDHPVCCAKKLKDDLIVVGLRNGEIQIYDLNNMELIINIKTHSYYEFFINQLEILPNGNLLSASSGGEIKLWKIVE